MNKRVLEGLVGGGAFDSLKPETRELHDWRGALSSSIDAALACAQPRSENASTGRVVSLVRFQMTRAPLNR